MKKINIKRLTTAAMLLAAGVLLPQIFHLAGGSAVGKIFLPMHIPVLLCGFICGPLWGAAVGFVCPMISSALTGMPQMFPTGFSQMGELAVYGIVAGVLYKYVIKTKWESVNIYASLVISMVCGRIVSGIIKLLLLMGGANPLTWGAFVSSALLVCWPGIIIQLVFIPLVIAALRRAKLSLL